MLTKPALAAPGREGSQEMGWAVWATLGRERPPLPWAGETLAVGFFPNSGLNLGWSSCKWVFNLPAKRASPVRSGPHFREARKMNVHCHEAQAFTDHSCLRTIFLSSLPFTGYNSFGLGNMSGDPQSRKCSFLFMQWFLHLSGVEGRPEDSQTCPSCWGPGR